MPQDLTSDEVGAPTLCSHHRAVISNLADRDHIDDRDSTRAANSISKQCPQCSPRRTP